MANNDDIARHYADIANAQLGERVTNLGRRQTDLENEMRSGFRHIEASFASFANETRTSIQSLSGTLAEHRRPQWQALGVALTFAAMLGALAYLPIREATTDLKAGVAVLAATTMTREEIQWRFSLVDQDKVRDDQTTRELRDSTVPRVAWEERNRARDLEVADLNRRIEELRQNVGSVYGTRDVIQDMRSEINSLRQRLDEVNTR